VLDCTLAMPRRLLSCAAALLVLAGCTSPAATAPQPVRLSYSFHEGDRSTYEMKAHAVARWRLGRSGSGSYDITLRVTEEIRSAARAGVIVRVTMAPIDVSENGLPAPGREPRRFELALDRDGAVRRVLSIDGVRAPALHPDELVVLGTYRPPLPEGPVAPGDVWRSQQRVGPGSLFRHLVTRGRLERLTGGSALAVLAYSGRGPLVWTTSLPEGAAELNGSGTTDARAVLDVDGGFLRSAVSHTAGRFEVRVVPHGAGPSISGRLRLELSVQLRRL
jgi:hypothetical protein